MKQSRYFLAVFLVVLLFPLSAFPDDMGLMRTSLITGDVLISGQDLAEWTAATVNLPLNEGDRLWVPEDGRLETQIRGGVSIRADEKTAFDILSLDVDSVQFYLDSGHVYINNRRGGIRTAQVDTPLASVRSFDGSIMMLDVAEEGSVEVSVLKGYAHAETRAGTTRVSAGSTLTLREDGTAEISPIGPTDDWERWNLDRDKQLTAWGESARYLPEELHEYSADLDENGRWAYTNDYGYVWTPGVTAVDWAPYTAGRWAWVRGNYVWISFEPWGWVPYHYGRWAYVSAFGWCWVPPAVGAVYWGPGFVGWVMTPTYVAWVPLAPGEIYYGYGYYGPASVNITTVNINTIVVKNVYKNAHVHNAVIAVERDTFGTGRRNPLKVKENPFLERKHERFDIVPPRVKPKWPVVLGPADREPEHKQPPERLKEFPRPEKPMTRQKMPSVPPGMKQEYQAAPHDGGKALEQRQPPERVRNIRPEELKAQRKLIKEKEGSVFKAGPSQNLPVKKMTEPKVIMRKPASQPATQPKPQEQQKFQKKGQTEKENGLKKWDQR